MHRVHRHFFIFYISFSIPFVYSLLVHSLISILLILLVHLLGVGWPTSKSLRRWALSKWDDDGNKTRGEACESGRYPCDSRQKFRPSGIAKQHTLFTSLDSRKVSQPTRPNYHIGRSLQRYLMFVVQKRKLSVSIVDPIVEAALEHVQVWLT